MTSMSITDERAGMPDDRAKRRVFMILGGLLIGLAASLPLAVAWPDAMPPPVGVCLSGTEVNPMERIWIKGTIIPLPCMPTFLFIQPAVLGGFLGAGFLFGLIACELTNRGSRWLPAALGGLCFLVLSFLGMWVVPRLTGPGLPLFISSGVAEPFALMIFGIAFLFAVGMGLALRTPGFVWRGLIAAGVTALCHWFVIWLLLDRAAMVWTHDPSAPPLAHSLPLLGNGMGPMMTTMLIGNLVSGTVGGWVTLALLTVRRSSIRERGESQLLVAEDGGVDL